MVGHQLEAAAAQLLLSVLAGVVAWGVLVRLAAGVARLPGLLGVLGRLAWRVLVPPAARLAVAGLLGVQTLVAAPALADVGSAATAGAQGPPAAEAGMVVGRPVTGLPTSEPAQPPGPAAVVVAPGDSLWRIAERHLPGDPVDADIARAWPRWFTANRASIGPDPNLLRIGSVLVPPADQARP